MEQDVFHDDRNAKKACGFLLPSRSRRPFHLILCAWFTDISYQAYPFNGFLTLG